VREMGIDQIQSLHRSSTDTSKPPSPPLFHLSRPSPDGSILAASCELSGVDSFQKQKRLDVFACADLSFASRSEKEKLSRNNGLIEWFNE